MFGEKDYQQLLVIRRLVRDLGLPVDIIGCPIVREPDGLAMSSRNAYLSPHARIIARELHRVLADLISRIRAGTSILEAERAGTATLLAAGFDSVDYVSVRDAATLAPLDAPEPRMRILAAARIAGTRLIDNVAA